MINIRSKEDEKACANKKKKFNTKNFNSGVRGGAFLLPDSGNYFRVRQERRENDGFGGQQRCFFHSGREYRKRHINRRNDSLSSECERYVSDQSDHNSGIAF